MLKMSRVIILFLILILPFSLFGLDVDFDINKVSSDANKTKKHIMLFLHKDNCGYCEIILKIRILQKQLKKIFYY